MDDILVPAVTGVIAAIPPTVGVLVVWLQNKARFDGIDQRFDAMDRRFDDTPDLWRAELQRVEEVLDARLKHLEEVRFAGSRWGRALLVPSVLLLIREIPAHRP